MCRICLSTKNTDVMKNMFKTSLDDESYSKLYEYCIGRRVKAEHNCNQLPTIICGPCEKNLLLSVSFRRQCLKSEKFLETKFSKKRKYPTSSSVSITSKRESKRFRELSSTDEPKHDVEFIDVRDESLNEIILKTEVEEKVNDDEPCNNYKFKLDAFNIKLKTENSKNSDVSGAVKEPNIAPEEVLNKLLKVSSLSIKMNNGNVINGADESDTIPYKMHKSHSNKSKPNSVSHIMSLPNISIKPIKTKQPAVPKEKKKLKKENVCVCQHCGKVIGSSHFKDHLATHEDVPYELRSFVCTRCDKRFKTKFGLRHHMKIHRQEWNSKFSCTYENCEMKFTNAETRTQHISDCHTHEYPFICNICNSKFAVIYSYKKHMRRAHTTEAPKHRCTYCFRVFNVLSQLRCHLATHTDERNFGCELCGKTYKTAKHLAVHKLTHGEKNYICPVCPAVAYWNNQALRHHIAKTHPDYDLPPPGTIMNKSYLEKRGLQHSNKRVPFT